MATITVDGQSLAIDGHRLWIVSGTVAYHRVPAPLWRDRLAAARHAGLNCIEVPVVWSLHEPRPGVFRFDGDLDIVQFIRLIGALHMRCIVRVGPHIGDGVDLGGMPPWLLKDAGPKLRTSAPEFLQPVSRFLAAVCARIQPLQASHSRKGGGPIIAVQNEHQWLCGNGAEAAAYLGETNRFLRENGINVPVLASNGLFAAAEGEIETWAGATHLHANVRQLRTLKPDHPRIVSALPTCALDTWERVPPSGLGGPVLLRRIAEVLAAGGQFNLAPFHGGTNFDFLGGRFEHGDFAPAAAASGAPLAETGVPGETYDAVRRICTFATQFVRVFTALDPGYQPAIIALDAHPTGAGRKGKPTTDDAPLVAVECRGSAGGIIFVFSPAEGDMVRRRAAVLLPDGSSLPVELERDRVAWILLGTHLVDRATLDYCNLNAVALVGSVFLCYGPEGMPGVVSINGSAIETIVPTGHEPQIVEHEGITIVVCNEESIAAAWVEPSSIVIGASGLDRAGHPVAHSAYKRATRISAKGERSTIETLPPPRKPKIAIGTWTVCPTDEFVSGKSERFASIEGPAPLEDLGAASGYAWMRLKFKGLSKKAKAGFFEATDRIHLYFDGEFQGVIGSGPGALPPVVPLPFADREHVVAVLIDNMGRRCEGNRMHEPKGIFGPIFEVASLRPGAPKIVAGKPIEPLRHWPLVLGLEDGDATNPRRITWRLQHRRRTPIIVRIAGLKDPALLLLDGRPLRLLPRHSVEHVVLSPEVLSRGTNELQIAVVGDAEAAAGTLRDEAEFFEGASVLSDRATWAFAKWEAPPASRFHPIPPKGPSEFKGRPAWWRALFTIDSTDAPFVFEPTGLSKGQLFINGRNISRYFVATRTGKVVPGQTRYYIPECWLKVGANEIMLFDEHGFPPDRARIIGS